MHKKIIIIFLNIIMVGMLRAQPNEAVLVDRYGAIRADMVRDVCALIGVNDTALLNKIGNESLKSFKDNIKNDTIRNIVNKAKTLSGTDLDKYIESIRTTRRDLLYAFSSYFPDKEIEAGKVFEKYFERIDVVTNEFRPTEQPINEEINTSSVQLLTSNKAKQTKASTIKGINFINVLLWIIAALAIFAIVYASIKRHRKKIVPYKNKKDLNDSKLLNNSLKKQQDFLTISDTHKETEQIRTDIETNIQSDGADITDEESNDVKVEIGGNSSAVDADKWIVVGASVQGNGHIDMEIPCQDSHAYEYLSDGWGIAIVSDGAGSAKLSHKGSTAIVSRTMFHFKNLIAQKEWITKNILPSDGEWMRESYRVLKQVYREISALSQHLDCAPKDLSATVIVVIHSPQGLLVVHVGDGRAGYMDVNGSWHSLITPHKGEEANQTIFMMSDFWNIPFYEMSGVMVPESLVIQQPVSAFTLMSDGCESTSWLCNQYNEDTGKYFDPNVPYAKFFNDLLETLQSFHEDSIPIEERQEKWFNFIKSGNKSFVKETDDKTMILALYKEYP